MNIDFKKLTYKEFYALINKVIMNTFNVVLDSKNNKEYYLKLKWYCSFISYFIRKNRLLRIDNFETVVANNKYYVEDYDVTIKCFNVIRLALINDYIFVNLEDIRNFCDKVVSEIKV